MSSVAAGYSYNPISLVKGGLNRCKKAIGAVANYVKNNGLNHVETALMVPVQAYYRKKMFNGKMLVSSENTASIQDIATYTLNPQAQATGLQGAEQFGHSIMPEDQALVLQPFAGQCHARSYEIAAIYLKGKRIQDCIDYLKDHPTASYTTVTTQRTIHSLQRLQCVQMVDFLKELTFEYTNESDAEKRKKILMHGDANYELIASDSTYNAIYTTPVLDKDC